MRRLLGKTYRDIARALVHARRQAKDAGVKRLGGIESTRISATSKKDYLPG